LWINYDEKWFYGFRACTNAKLCEALGLEKQEHYLYHKNHVNKVMVLAATAFTFDQNVENGGKGVKLGIWQIQGARIAKKRQKAGRWTGKGKMKYNGKVVREMGEVYLVDTTVTGADEGTSDKPKFSLKLLFKMVLFPEVMDLVGPGRHYEGYTPIFQGDNA